MAARSRSAASAGAAGRNQPAGKGRVRAAVYLRVSTEGQLDGTSIDTQRAHCADLASRHRLTLISEHVDAGVSGAAASRPALDELLAAATAGDIDVVLVAKLDRLGRSLLHLLELLETFDGLGVRVLAIDEAAACIRAMYRLLVRERVPLTQAVSQLNAAGHRCDSGTPWTKQTLSRWARRTDPPPPPAPGRWLDLQVPIPPILTMAEHSAWRAWLRQTTKPAQRHTTYLLGGRVVTPCGRYFHGRTAGKQNPLYVCRHHLTTPAGDADRCGCLSIRVEVLDQLVWSQVRAALTIPTPSTATPAAAGHSHRRRRRTDNEPHARMGAGVDIGADTLTARITATAEDIAALQATIAEEYQAARADGFDPATARLMPQTRRDQLAHAQAALELLHRVRTNLTPPLHRTVRTGTRSSGRVSVSMTSTLTASSSCWTYWASGPKLPATTRARPAPGLATPPSHPAHWCTIRTSVIRDRSPMRPRCRQVIALLA